MQFRRMTATFGTLDHRTIQFENGLNIIEAPNESGKSTLLAFLRVMLYGFTPRERGAAAEKNRYAPWSLAPMQGVLELRGRMGDITVMRDTVRAGDPMGRFSAVYTGSGESVPGLTAEDLGETLLGIPREVYERSAFIRQSGMCVDASAELERRIAALITTGEEGTSCTDALAALKKQRNARRYHRSGRISSLEAETDELNRSLDELTQLEAHRQEKESALRALDAEEQRLCGALRAHDLCDAQEQYQAVAQAGAAADEAANALERAQRAMQLSACPTRETLAQGRAALDALLSSYDAAADALLALIPAAGSLARVSACIDDALAQYDALDALTQQAQTRRAQYELLAQQHPARTFSDASAVRPAQSREELRAALSALSERRRTLQSELDHTLGRCRAVGERETLEAQLAQKQEALSRLQAEYDAIALAMDALQRANTTLQSRFSPALSRRAGELFSRLTDGKYESVLLDRDLSAQAGERGEAVAHDAQLLSLGALDQLYLAVRLAICERVLPDGDPIPLVLDDALVHFDDARCRKALELLYEESKTRQILLFTCQHRESAFLAGRSGVTVLSL